MFALGLPGFCTFLYMVRVLQAMQDTRTAFRIYLVENGINIVFGILLVGPLGVHGLALSVSIAYSAAAILALAVVPAGRRTGGDDLTTPVLRVLGASTVMAVTTVLTLSVSGADSGVALLGRVVGAVVVGAVTYVGAAAVLGERAARRAAAERAPRARPPLPRHRRAVRPLRRDGLAVGAVDRPGFRRTPIVGAVPWQTRRRVRIPVRHLRPVPTSSGVSRRAHRWRRSAGDGSAEEPVDPRPPDEEEEAHGPDPGGHR